MKSVVFISSICLVLLSSFRSSIADAGNGLCKSYFPVEVGTVLTYENYNKKDKLQGTDSFSITDIVETAEVMTIKIHSTFQDGKGKEVHDSNFEYTCEDGVFKMSMDNMISPEMIESMEGMEMEFTQSEIEMPSNMTVGQSLPDAQMNFKASMNGMEIMTMKFDITERKVEGVESVTTDAGTFDCFKLSQKTTSDMKFMSKTYKTVDWVAENIGSVKSETYNEQGELESYRVLKSIKR